VSAFDLVVLAADLDIQQVLQTLLERRTDALGIRRPTVWHLKHPGKDSGCYGRPDDVLGSSSIAERALVVFDTAFGGARDQNPDEMAAHAERRLAPIWGDRAHAVAIHPEVEAWLWDGHHVVDALGWQGDYAALRSWLAGQGLWETAAAKPTDPKEALDRVIKRTSPGVRRGIFEHVAARASVKQCTDASNNVELRNVTNPGCSAYSTR